jgi:DNA-binding transcriptional MerR regulator/quercetin dioxygenase-like cupin family protein
LKKTTLPDTNEPEKIKGKKPRSYPAGFLTVGQTARVLGVSASTLRVWENVGLVTPARSNGRFRLYTTEMLGVLKRIKYLRDVKQLSVPGIKQLLGEQQSRKQSKPRKGAVRKTPKEAANLGARLRSMRKRSSIGIAEAAQQAGISAGFLSAIELSRANASVATLSRLAAAYGTTVLEFFDLPQRSNLIIRPNERRVLKTDGDVTMEVLSIGTKLLQCMIFRVPPSTGSDGAYSHEGEEFIYMLSGTIEFWLDEMECYILEPGDSFWFDSTMGHRWFNASDVEAVLLWINTPVTF